MEIKTGTALSYDIQTAANNARYDAAVKRLLSDRKILAHILKDCVEEFRNTDISDIADRCIEHEPQMMELPAMPGEVNAVSKIHGTGVEDVTATEGTVVYDIRFEAAVLTEAVKAAKVAADRIIIDLEAQNDFYPGYPLVKRAIYYCSRLISSQYGTVFTRANYKKIKKVYSIFICTNPPKKRSNTSY